MRLGNSAEAVEAAKCAVHLSDSVLRLCLTVAHLNKAMYFACDNVLWAGKAGLLPQLDQVKWSQRSFRYYLFALILNLTRDAYEIRLLMEREARSSHVGSKATWTSSPPSPHPSSLTPENVDLSDPPFPSRSHITCTPPQTVPPAGDGAAKQPTAAAGPAEERVRRVHPPGPAGHLPHRPGLRGGLWPGLFGPLHPHHRPPLAQAQTLKKPEYSVERSSSSRTFLKLKP